MKSLLHYFTQMFLHEFDSLHLEIKGLGRFIRLQIWTVSNMTDEHETCWSQSSDSHLRQEMEEERWPIPNAAQGSTLCVCVCVRTWECLFLSGQEGKVRENVCASLWEREWKIACMGEHLTQCRFDTVQIKMLRNICVNVKQIVSYICFLVFHSRQVCACLCEPG